MQQNISEIGNFFQDFVQHKIILLKFIQFDINKQSQGGLFKIDFIFTINRVLFIIFDRCQAQSKYIWLQLFSQFFQMFHKASSFTSFRKIINRTTITCNQQKTDLLSQGELMIQSKIQQQPLELGLQSEKSKVVSQCVRSSIDSQQHRKKQSTGSIPLSELILRDNGYDHLFHTKEQIQKIQQKYIDNIREIHSQTEQMMNLVSYQLLILEESELKQKICDLERDIGRLRAYRKSKSPIQQNSDYLHSMGKKRKERLSGRLLQIHAKQNRSNMKTQCDSKPPSLPSAPVTPINQNKLMISPSKCISNEYIAILKAKRDVLQDSVSTISQFTSQRASQLKKENNIIRQELLLLNSRIHLTPLRQNNILSPQRHLEAYRASSTRKSLSSRRLIGLCSPQTNRDSKKNQIIKLISGMRSEARLNPREQYFLASR